MISRPALHGCCQAPVRLSLLLSMGLALAWAGPARAGCERTLVVPVSDMGPLVRVSDSVSGAFPDYLRAIGERAGCSFQFVPTPRRRAERLMFETQAVDVFLPATQSARRDRDFVFVPLFRQSLGVAVKQGQDTAVPDTLEALLLKPHLRAAFVRGVFLGPDYEHFVNALVSARRADMVGDWATLGRMLRAGRIGFSIVPLPVAQGSFDDGQPLVPSQAISLRPLRNTEPIISGLYLSKRLPAADLASLQRAFGRSLAEGDVTKAFSPLPGGVTQVPYKP